MGYNNRFAQWASLCVTAFNENTIDSPLDEKDQRAYTGVTQAASELLQSIDAGGVPAFITNSLIEIANENGVDVPDHWTPNEIVDAIRAKSDVANPVR